MPKCPLCGDTVHDVDAHLGRSLPNCDKAPDGWYCTRRKGHDGPCAAVTTTACRTAPYIANVLKLFMCELCIDDHGENPQSVSCYCACHDSRRDEQRWTAVRRQVLAALKRNCL